MVSAQLAGSVVLFLGYLGLCYLVGLLLIAWLPEAPDALLTIASPLLGSGAMALQLTIFGLLRIPWNPITLVAPWLLLAVLRRRAMLQVLNLNLTYARRIAGKLGNLDRLDLVLVIALLMTAGAYLLSLVAQPLTAWDAIAMWLYKAKLFYGQQAVDLSPIAKETLRHLDYPPLFSMQIASLFSFLGGGRRHIGEGHQFPVFRGRHR